MLEMSLLLIFWAKCSIINMLGCIVQLAKANSHKLPNWKYKTGGSKMTNTKISAVIKHGEATIGDFVRWDGTQDMYRGVTTELKTSEIYRVVDIEIHFSYTHLILQEASTGTIFEEGFSSLLFTKVPVQQAISTYAPSVGYRYNICKVVVSNGQLTSYSGTTSKVIARYPNGRSNWYTITRNSVYDVMVVLPEET